ncbi:uncharacterized protein TNIN_84961 [Trichonephila inaurata madagascariensis]|uniref:Tesmin/TSO1-like CXC domain-containing protein n=1 Tax=Trichonephila inaurata madagascariensis TaxID=2747483 RepID=A0A8X6IT52_9ARAC|nr:uncharacterized protein TNIN_84961 [Trichonephila inaurata madagascariensis]
MIIKKGDPEEERLRIAEAAAAIIREDIRSSVVETKSYPPPIYHPQPRILSLESGTLVQYVGENAHINVHTLDSNNTLHVMGMIKIVTPKDDVLYDDRIQKRTSKPCAKELAAISHVSFLAYEKPIVPGYNKILVENPHGDQTSTEKNFNGVDFCGYMESGRIFHRCLGGMAFSNSSLKIIRILLLLRRISYAHSFLGSIAYIMDESGLKEALGKIYATNSVDKMLNDHVYSRNIRGRTLLRLAMSIIMFEDMKIEDCMLNELTEQINCRNVSYEGVEGCVALDFIRAERLGLLKEHLNAVQRMLPYFHASGHFLYAMSAHLYLQDMIDSESTMGGQTFKNIKKGFFTVKRTEKFNSGTWTDMVIEQSLMKSMKREGGVSHGQKSVDFTTKQAGDDADVLIVGTSIEESKHHRTAVIVGEDIDLLGKNFIRILENLPNLDQLAQVFQEQNCNVQTLHENGIRVLLKIYNAPKSKNSIDNLRYTQFIRSTKLNQPVQLSNLPPTSAAAHQHINHVYYQVQTWLGNDLEPQKWDELLNTIFCNCKNGCGSRYGCRKSGLQCSSACQCNGQACFNASRYESYLDEDCTFDPEILQDLETNILDDENNEKELEIFE